MKKLVKEVAAHYRTHKRDLPWRPASRKATQGKLHVDPYKILVSEIMLQQTQVARVLPKYQAFIKTFPHWKALAAAPLSQVLKLWSGLGYNRRGKFLHEAAKKVCSVEALCFGEMNGNPTPAQRASTARFTTEFLESLPGVGPYTARAVSVFAFDREEVFIETNIRTVFTHFCFPHTTRVSDKELLPLIAQALPLARKAGLSPREWYAALMDYGAYLKTNGVRINSRSVHYTKQKKFKGSVRQLRGAIVRELLQSPKTVLELSKNISRTREEINKQLLRLEKEKLIAKQGKQFTIPK